MLFNEPKLLKYCLQRAPAGGNRRVSVLFNEPKLLKSRRRIRFQTPDRRFSALQRAEIAEIDELTDLRLGVESFSALQRAEIAEIQYPNIVVIRSAKFQCSSTSRNC